MTAPVVYSIVKGMKYRGQAAWFAVHDLEEHDPVIVQRDPENEYDGNAVKVLAITDYEDTIHIGFIERAKAAVMSEWMDAGFVYQANVHEPAIVDGDTIFIDTMWVVCRPMKPLKQKSEVKESANV